MSISSLVVVVILSVANVASADTFDAGGANEFTIDFVNISGDTNPTSGYGIVNNDYRMGTYEISNDQWNKFTNINGTPTGNPSSAYDKSATFTGTDVPVNGVSWYECAQFINYLNTSTGHAAAYKFTGTQGTVNYIFTPWNVTDTGYDASKPYRNSNAYYFMPSEHEWVKAAYWNGTSLQTYATKAGESLSQGDGTSGTGWNYYDDGYAIDPFGPWDVGSGSEELNGTFDMMGNLKEWMESRYINDAYRVIRGSGSGTNVNGIGMLSSFRTFSRPNADSYLGFRVASVPEPTTLLLLGLGGLVIRRRRRRC